MHILVVALHRPIEPTGVCRHAANLAKCLALRAEVTKVTLVTGAWQQHYFQNIFLSNPDKITVLGVDIKNSALSRNRWFLFGLPRLVDRVRPDLVHLSFPLPFIRSLFPCPVVSTIHDLYPYKIPENFGWKQVIFNKIFLQQCISNSDAFSCVSVTSLDDLYHYFPSTKLKHAEVIYNSIDFDRVSPICPQALAERSDRPLILCVGQHRKNKNFDLAIAAVAKSIAAGKIDRQMQLIIVGSVAPETANLHRAVAENSLTDSVLFLAGINDRELCWLYHHCALMLVPSAVEGFCLPLVEALYFSCQVVCSDIPIFREIGSSNCTYFKLAPDPVGNLTEAIARAIATEISQERYDSSRFSPATIADRYLNFYQVVRQRTNYRQ